MSTVNSQETETMKAIIQEVYGGPEVLHFATVDRPVAGPRDLLVRIIDSSILKGTIIRASKGGGFAG